jgi:osmotically-inducible protein OsmY
MTMPWNDDVRADVEEALAWDPKVDANTIAVSAADGHITLRGTVGSVREKLEAKKAAAGVFGVDAVKDEVQVRLLDDQRRTDAELRADVLQALMLDSAVPATVDARVEEGIVTLLGKVDWQYQREEAERVAANIVDALGVLNGIELTHPLPDAGVVDGAIRNAFERMTEVDGSRLVVTAVGGTVTISGQVRTFAERNAALAAAWAAPGVLAVDDQMTVNHA